MRWGMISAGLLLDVADTCCTLKEDEEKKGGECWRKEEEKRKERAEWLLLIGQTC